MFKISGLPRYRAWIERNLERLGDWLWVAIVIHTAGRFLSDALHALIWSLRYWN